MRLFAPEQLFAARRGYSCRFYEGINEHGNVLRRALKKRVQKIVPELSAEDGVGCKVGELSGYRVLVYGAGCCHTSARPRFAVLR